jgi:hypothetical protein
MRRFVVIALLGICGCQSFSSLPAESDGGSGANEGGLADASREAATSLPTGFNPEFRCLPWLGIGVTCRDFEVDPSDAFAGLERIEDNGGAVSFEKGEPPSSRFLRAHVASASQAARVREAVSLGGSSLSIGIDLRASTRSLEAERNVLELDDGRGSFVIVSMGNKTLTVTAGAQRFTTSLDDQWHRYTLDFDSSGIAVARDGEELLARQPRAFPQRVTLTFGFSSGGTLTSEATLDLDNVLIVAR